MPPQTSDAVPLSGPLDAPLTEPLPLAIALQPPSQSDTPHRPVAGSAGLRPGPVEEGVAPVSTEVAVFRSVHGGSIVFGLFSASERTGNGKLKSLTRVINTILQIKIKCVFCEL